VTVMEAHPEMDHGDVYATKMFKMPEGSSKSILYNSEVSDAGELAVLEAIKKI